MFSRPGQKMRQRLITVLALLLSVTSALSQNADFVVQTGHPADMYRAVFSPDSRLLASIDSQTNVLLWDVATGRQLRALDCLIGSFDIAFSKDSLLVGIDDEGKARFCNVGTGVLQKTVDVGGRPYYASTRLSPNGDLVAFGFAQVLVVNLVTGQRKTCPIEFDPNLDKEMAFDSRGQFLAISDGRRVHQWNIETGDVQAKDLPAVNQPEFGKGHFPELDKDYAEQVEKNRNVEIKSRRKITALAFSHDMTSISIAMTDLVDLTATDRNANSSWFGFLGTPFRFAITTWSLSSNELILTFDTGNNYSGTNRINNIAYMPGDRSLVSGNGDGSVRFWDLATGTEESSLRKSDAANFVAFSRDMRRIARISSRGRFEVWDIQERKVLSAFEQLVEPIQSLKFSRGLEYLAVGFTRDGGKSKAIKLLDLRSGKTFRTLTDRIESSDGYVYSMEFNNDASLFASASGSQVKLWDVNTGSERDPLGSKGGKVYSIAFSPDGKLLASVNSDGYTRIWDVASRKEILSRRMCPDLPHYAFRCEPLSVSFNARGNEIAVGTSRGSVVLWNLATNSEIKILLPKERFKAWAVGFDKTEKTMYAGSDDYMIYRWDVASGHELEPLEENEQSLQLLAKTAPRLLEKFCLASPNGRLDPEKGEVGEIRLRDTETWKVMAKIVALKSGGWVTATPDGRFDTSEDLGDGRGLHWVISDAPLKALPLELFMRQYYEPGLLPRLLKCIDERSCGKEFKPVPPISEINRVQPLVKITRVTPSNIDGRVNVKTEVESVSDGSDRESGIYDLRLFRDGQLVGASTPREAAADYNLRSIALSHADEKLLWRKTNDVFQIKAENVRILSATKAEITFHDIRLPRDGRKQTNFSAYAFNADKVKSSTTEPSVFSIPERLVKNPRKGRAFLISIGVNASENPLFDLNYAANDARKSQDVLGGGLSRAADRYAEVIRVPLISDRDTSGRLTVNTAQKAIIRGVFALLSGDDSEISKIPKTMLSQIPNRRQIRAVEPEDTLIVTFAGHGYADSGGNFYLLPYDIGHQNIQSPDAARKFISSDELALWMRDVTASEMIFVIDACYSAAAVKGNNFKPGPLGSRGLGQLAYDKDMKILAAAQANDVALEVGKLQHGLLSYALLHDGIIKGLADADKNGELLSGELLTFAERRVPEIYAEIATGRRSIVVGGRANSKVKSRAETFATGGKKTDRRRLQQPSLFDFGRRKRNDPLFRLSRGVGGTVEPNLRTVPIKLETFHPKIVTYDGVI